MTNLTLTKTRLIEGVWEGVLTGVQGDSAPKLTYQYHGADISGLKVTKENGEWIVRAAVPKERVSDGVHTFVIADEAGTPLADFSLIAGEALANDIRAEVNVLRAELDLLKKAFRRQYAKSQRD